MTRYTISAKCSSITFALSTTDAFKLVFRHRHSSIELLFKKKMMMKIGGGILQQGKGGSAWKQPE
jgi:hypothetical protein